MDWLFLLAPGQLLVSSDNSKAPSTAEVEGATVELDEELDHDER